MFGGGGINASNKGIVPAPPGLGDEDDEEQVDDLDYDEQQKNQPAVRVDDRAGGAGGSSRASGCS